MAEFKRLARVRDGNLGNFGFLPLEVCNNVYAFLLADFHPSQHQLQSATSRVPKIKIDFTKLTHSIDTAILRVSRDVHLEAYDLMVKKNGFVHVKSRGASGYLLKMAQMSIVTANADHIGRFKGYVLGVTVTSQEELPPGLPAGALEPLEVMVLARDSDILCHSLMVGNTPFPGFTDRMNLTLNLGLVVTASRDARDYQNLESLGRYFSERTQKKILQPFHDHLYDVQNMQVCGLVSVGISSSTCKGAASAKWGRPQEALDYFTAHKEKGMRYLERGQAVLASSVWLCGVDGIDMLRKGKHWPQHVQEGGELFITQLAELYFRLTLNCAHVLLGLDGNDTTLQLAQHTLEDARQAMTTGHWKEGFTWEPPRELRAKHHFRTARCSRLIGDFRGIEAAMQQLDDALLLCPSDPAILRERRLVSEWASEAVMTEFVEQLDALPLGTPE